MVLFKIIYNYHINNIVHIIIKNLKEKTIFAIHSLFFLKCTSTFIDAPLFQLKQLHTDNYLYQIILTTSLKGNVKIQKGSIQSHSCPNSRSIQFPIGTERVTEIFHLVHS